MDGTQDKGGVRIDGKAGFKEHLQVIGSLGRDPGRALQFDL